MSAGRIPTTANSPLTAKGDLFTYSTAPARLAVGSNGEQIVADSSTSTGLRYQPTMAAGKNYCINGAFDIWQRGTTFTNPGGGSGTYTADRWTVYFNGNGTVTQETSVKPDTSTYALKVTATASSADNSVYQLIEQLNMEQFRGKTITLSVKVAGTATLAPAISLAYSTTADNSLTATNTAITASSETKPAINASTFVTYISQFAVPTTAKTLRIQLGSGTMANTNVLYWAEAQIEIGSVATNFSRAGGTIQGELAAAQRYYYAAANGTLQALFNGSNYSTTAMYGAFSFPVQMRVAPTLSATSGAGIYEFARNGAADAFNSLSAYATSTTNVILNNTTEISGTAGNGGFVTTSNLFSGLVSFSAEL